RFSFLTHGGVTSKNHQQTDRAGNSHRNAEVVCGNENRSDWIQNSPASVLIFFSGSTESIRLVNGDNQCSGRLEVKSNNSWSIVCEDDFDHQDAEVVCRELGCGATSVLQGALYGETEAPEWSREFLCEGHESALLKCRSSQLTRWTCPPGKAVEITCSDPDQVMLVGGASRCTGELHLKHHQEWRPVQLFYGWSPELFQVVCHRLNCGSFVSEEFKSDRGERPVWRIKPDCMKSLSLWRECVDVDDSSSSVQINITCSGNNCFLFSV
uniref:SRCR domain-containing protein n=1 Tax=Oryzias melastigma TaxID=30732 RepID=A0A3B3DJ16_ORYME